ncbi:hypothetical protein [Streptomyces yaizuensis]|uniref:Uncharacterized protein n=1 Tax=Streptomyces yaizuensis TaxID=2989713 RepID=A0ABQ5P9F3_9ACTN|nr:hypothetical protein [Streptomyces sp. YSPA8]GLF99207.1 hypothetical protein SYYSPA8_32940 [Streptomyces sp. YSPA8]
MLIGSRAGFGLDLATGLEGLLLHADVFVGGLLVNAADNAFYPPLLAHCLGGELRRHGSPSGRPTGFTTPAEAFRAAERWAFRDTGATEVPGDPGPELARYEFLEWGECTDGVTAYAFPDGDRVHLGCRLRAETGPPQPPVTVTLGRTLFVTTLERARVVAADMWAARPGQDGT